MLKLEEGQYLGINQQHYQYGALRFIDTSYHEKVFNGWHMHEHPHLTFVLDGGNLEKRKNKELQLDTGQLIFYHSGELHRNDHTVFPSRNLNLEIEPVFFKDYQLSEHHIDSAIKNGSLASLAFIQLFKEAIFKDMQTADSLHLLLLSFLSHPNTKDTPLWLLRLRNLLNDRWDTWPTLSDLADESGVHPVTISKYFHRFFGCTLSAYMRKIKAQHALPMIKSGNYTLSEISHACGFTDQSHFIRCFKGHTGMLPKHFERF